MDDKELVFMDTATKCGGYDMPRKEPDQEHFERIAAAYLAEAKMEGLTSIRYDIVSLLVTLQAPRRPSCAITRTSSTTGGDPKAAAPGFRARGRTGLSAYQFAAFFAISSLLPLRKSCSSGDQMAYL